jgi:hypothetical protein
VYVYVVERQRSSASEPGERQADSRVSPVAGFSKVSTVVLDVAS